MGVKLRVHNFKVKRKLSHGAKLMQIFLHVYECGTCEVTAIAHSQSASTSNTHDQFD